MDLNKGDTGGIILAARDAGILRNQLAYILATTAHETAFSMKPVYESYYLGEPRATIFNRKKSYWPHYGRGYVQLTWAANYEKADRLLNLNGELVADPDLAMQPQIATRILIEGMMGGWFTGKKLSDYVTLQKSDFVNARRVVNGTDKAEEIAELARGYDTALKAMGYGESLPDTTATLREKLAQAERLIAEVRRELDA